MVGIAGAAESVAPLDESETVTVAGGEASLAAVKPVAAVLEVSEAIGETAKSALHDHASEVMAEMSELSSSRGMSLFWKCGLVGVIVMVCYGFIKAQTSRRRVPAGRHGAYAKGGIA